MEHNHKSRKTITVERISITTIRTRGRGQKFYCNVCGEEVDPLPLAGEQLRLDGASAIDVLNTAIDGNETNSPFKLAGQTKKRQQQ